MASDASNIVELLEEFQVKTETQRMEIESTPGQGFKNTKDEPGEDTDSSCHLGQG